MISRNDYIIINDLGYRLIGKVIFLGNKKKKLRNLTILPIHPHLGRELFSVVVDITKVEILDEKQIEVVKCLYE